MTPPLNAFQIASYFPPSEMAKFHINKGRRQIKCTKHTALTESIVDDGYGAFTLLISAHFTPSQLTSFHANWVVRRGATQFAVVAATNHSAAGSDEMRSADTRSDEVGSGEMSDIDSRVTERRCAVP